VGTLLVRDGREILALPAPGIDDSVLRPFITGSGLAVLFWQRGLLVLHASAVQVDGAAAAFLGDPGAGKSSTAAAFQARGHAVLSDDVTVLDPNGCAPAVLPGPAQLKLFPKTAALFGMEGRPEPTGDPGQVKLVCRTRNSAAPSPAPLRRVYVLSPEAGEEPEPLPPGAALLELVRQSYPTRFGVVGGRDHFFRCTRLVNRVPFFRLRSLESIESLPSLIDVVWRHLAVAR
jgi:hypothetical protein